jgi:microcystin-dependent protein
VSKHRQLLYGQPMPQSFLDAMQEFIGTLATNFALTLAPGSMNQVQVVAPNADNGQVGIGINGLWRYINATITTIIAGAAGTYDLYVTTGSNSFITNPSPPPPELDQTNYTFALTAVATGTQPTGAPHFRMVGQAVFDGTRILALRQMVGGQVDGQQLLQPGMIQLTAAPTAPPGWLLCNGLAVSRTTYAALYAALGGPGSAWGQGDGSTTFNVPDLRGRVPVGAGTAVGVPSGPVTNRALGVPDGLEQMTLQPSQLPSHGHSMDFYSQAEDRDHEHLYPGASVSGGPRYAFQDPAGSNNWTNVLVGPIGSGGYGFANGTGSHWDLQTVAYPYDGAGSVPAAWTTGRNTGHLHEVVGSTNPVGSNGLISVVQPLQVVNYLVKT